MAKIITALRTDYSVDTLVVNPKLFLAGGIRNCPDWQSEMIKKLSVVERLTIFNPRRADFPQGDPHATEEQICWEYEHLKKADLILFWFSRGSLNPISLYELGRWGNSSDIPLFIGCDPEYERGLSVLIQTKLSRPEVNIVHSMDALAGQVIEFLEMAG